MIRTTPTGGVSYSLSGSCYYSQHTTCPRDVADCDCSCHRVVPVPADLLITDEVTS